jgi:hypothetical protein
LEWKELNKDKFVLKTVIWGEERGREENNMIFYRKQIR